VTFTLRCKYLLVCCMLCGFTSVASGSQMLLTGNAEGVWLVRGSEGGETFDVVAKSTGGKWKWIKKELRGKCGVAAAIGKKLHVLQTQPDGYLIFDLSDAGLTYGLNPHDARWPEGVRPLAACEAEGFGASKRTTIVAAVPRKARSASPTESQAPRGAEATITAAVFQNVKDQWTYIDELEGLAPDSRALTAVVDGGLYLLVAGEAETRNQLFTWKAHRWRNIPLKGPLASSHAVAMLSVKDNLIILLTAAAEDAEKRGLLIATADDDAEGFTFQPVTRSGAAATWPATNLPLVTRLADGLAILWPEGANLKFSTCGLNGELMPAGDVDIFQKPPADSQGEEIWQYFLWGVLIATFIPMLLLRPRNPARPFSLGENIRPGRLPARLLAATIDFVPFNFLAGGIFISTRPSITPQELMDMFEQRHVPVDMVYGVVGCMLLYVAYCIFMELRFSATLGKMLFKLRVVGDEGRPPGLREVTLRNLLKIIELSWPPLLPLLVLLPLFTRNHQRLGDMLARTAVVDARSKTPAPPPDEPQEPPA